jgi:hypothetical protein
MTILYILCSFVTFFPVLVSCTKKNLATLVKGRFEKLESQAHNIVYPWTAQVLTTYTYSYRTSGANPTITSYVQRQRCKKLQPN